MERIKKALLQAREERENIELSLNKTEETLTEKSESFHENITSTIKSQDKYLNKNVTLDVKLLERNKILCNETPVPIRRAYKMLRTRFLQRLDQNNWNTIGVISPSTRDGKSLTAINLAISIAQDLNHTALLADFDFLQPSIHTYLGIKPDISIGECISKHRPLSDCLISTNIPRLTFALTNEVIEDSSELLAGKAAQNMSKEVKGRYGDRVVLYDLPPILVCDDAISFLPNVDAVLVILRENKTKRSDVEAAFDMLGDKPIAGVILNDSTHGINDYYY